MSNLPQSLAVAALGGAIGASSRYLVLTVFQGGAFGVFAVNMVGCLALGFALTFLADRSDLWTVFIGAGILGGLTTFSTFSGDIVRLLETQPLQAALYVGASVAIGVALFILGAFLARGLA